MTTTRARGCDGKHGHDTRAAADRHMRDLIHRCGAAEARLNVYRCRHCRLYHVGHRLRQRRQV
jgi:hypothetical protein